MPLLPRIAVTLGDPAGIGPWAAVRAAETGALRALSLLFVGEEALWRRAGWSPGLGPLLSTGLGVGRVPQGRPTALSGRVSFAALQKGVELAARGAVRALLTSPISKTAWKMAAIPYPGHTEYLAGAAGSPHACMILGAPRLGLWTALATRHIPLKDVPAAATPERVVETARALGGAMRALGRRGRLGLCALNPHAGEGGLLGKEEAGLARAAAAARARGVALSGPLPADSAWREHREGRWAGLVCLYHDQALMPLKALAGFGIVNWTAGLPFPRVSPGHGTAFDAVRKAPGRPAADPSGFVAAAELAASLLRGSGL